MPSITLRNIIKKFDEHTALSNINLEVKSGEYLVLLGPTGAGKTTLLRIISGLLRPDGGKIKINGKDVTKTPPEDRGVTYMSQTYSLFPHLTVWDNVIFSPTVRGVSPADSIKLGQEMLLMVGLIDRSDAYPKELSGGMQQRTALARALTTGTKILLLDEPLRALDARLRIALRLNIRRLCKDLGITAIHVTHDQEEALLVADRLVILRHGKIEQIGSSEDIYNHPDNPFIAEFLGEANFFTGHVEKVTNETTTVRSNGRSWMAAPSIIQKGQEVCLTVKAENINLIRDSVVSPNVFKAIVRRRAFLGKFVRFEMESKETEFPVKAKLGIEKAKGISEGDSVTAWFDQKDGLVLPVPPYGLAKELELE